MYTEYEIRQMPLSLGLYRRKVEQFLATSGLRMADDIDYYAAVFRCGDDEMLAGGGLSGNIIKCIAVDNTMREEGFSSRLISHLVSQAVSNGFNTVKVFTKPENKQIFESMAFTVLAEAPKAILMENGQQGLKSYTNYLKQKREQIAAVGNAVCGAIVMNANPFTLGHRYLTEQAAKQVDWLFVIAVREDVSEFSYSERFNMITKGCADISNVTVVEGSDYQISQTTFPTYFLKQLNDATDTQITLDLDIFARHIAPALGIACRFVGTEPTDHLTKRYNELMAEQLTQIGIKVVETERLKTDTTVSASLVRKHLSQMNLTKAAQYVPLTTLPYLVSHTAANSLRAELMATPKPGLIDQYDSGAHHDMNFNSMMRSIEALLPSFSSLATQAFADTLPPTDSIRKLGIEAEKQMLAATKGINTHKGALFSMGLAVVATSYLLYIYKEHQVEASQLQSAIKQIATGFTPASNTHGAEVNRKHPETKGALSMAQEGYRQLFDCWLPFYRENKGTDDAPLRTLILIMSQIDDTNILHRTNKETANHVKEEALLLLNNFSREALSQMNQRFIEQNISPGGAADMLALTIFADAVCSE